MQEAFKDKDNPPKLSRHASMNEWADFDLEKHKAQRNQNDKPDNEENQSEGASPHAPHQNPDDTNHQQTQENQREGACPHAPHSPADKPGILDMKSLLMQNTDILQDCLEDNEEEHKEQGKEVLEGEN